MITKFKIFESNRVPKIGDYVLVNISDKFFNKKIKKFIHNNIGKIVNKSVPENNINPAMQSQSDEFSSIPKTAQQRKGGLYLIEYENVPKDLNFSNLYNITVSAGNMSTPLYKNRRLFFGDEIKYFGSTKEEVEMQMNAERYNI